MTEAGCACCRLCMLRVHSVGTASMHACVVSRLRALLLPCSVQASSGLCGFQCERARRDKKCAAAFKCPAASAACRPCLHGILSATHVAYSLDATSTGLWAKHAPNAHCPHAFPSALTCYLFFNCPCLHFSLFWSAGGDAAMSELVAAVDEGWARRISEGDPLEARCLRKKVCVLAA